jgi:hypothetical protein
MIVATDHLFGFDIKEINLNLNSNHRNYSNCFWYLINYYLKEFLWQMAYIVELVI